jgi:very-short-patch-repair endonuclease
LVAVHVLRSGERRHREGLPVTTIEQTICDLASVLTPAQLEFAVDDVLRRKLTTLDRLRRPLLRSGRAKVGATKLKELLDERETFDSALESRLETEFMRFVLESGLPIPMAQVRIVDQARCLARVDFLYPDVGLAIEVDGYEFHSGKVRWQKDMWRGTELAVRGLRTLRFSRADIQNRPEVVAKQIVEARSINVAL